MRYLRKVVTLQHDEAACTSCGSCLNVCPHGVFEQRDGRVRVKERDRCMECGACAMNCPFGAIEVKRGVGCAAAILRGLLTGTEPSCG